MKSRALGAMSVLLLSSLAGAQDVDVPNNLTMRNSTDIATGNILKDGVLFIHNYGAANTFVGSNAGNMTTMRGGQNTAIGASALLSNTTGSANTATGVAALVANAVGYGNAAHGYSALLGNTTGSLNTASGFSALVNNATGNYNTATGATALWGNFTGDYNTASGEGALYTNHSGSNNTGIGYRADVRLGNLSNATAIGAGAIVDASNKVRLGNDQVTVIEGEVGFTASSDRNQKENLRPVDGEDVLNKIRELSLTSWNFIGHDPKQFRHYGPIAQDFFAAFGHDAIGTIGTETTITSTDIDGILMIAAQALEKRTAQHQEEMDALRADHAREIKALKARLEIVERRAERDAQAKAE